MLEDAVEPWLFGWDHTPGIVSVWATSQGEVTLWRRVNGELRCESGRFRPWLFAAHLRDLERAGINVSTDQNAPVTVVELPHDNRSLRYLLTARNGRKLEQDLKSGVEKRTGSRPRDLRQTGEYYSLGPVEQYLIWTGKCYFRNLVFEELVRLQLDLETTSLDPQRGRIFMAAMKDSTGWEQILEAPSKMDEPDLIRGICEAIKARDPDVLENHNIVGFDLPYLEARAARHGLHLDIGRPPAPVRLRRLEFGARGVRYSVAGREILDTLDATRRVDFVMRKLPSHGLKAVARYFQVAAPERVEIPGAEMFPCYQRDPARVRSYALQDVREVASISDRLHRSAYALAKMAPRRFERVAYAGTATGILEPMLVRAYLQKKRALPKPLRRSGAVPHMGGAVKLYATGVAERVVKADVASLYPSIIRTYGIGPKSDRLKAFHGIVSRLTELRLDEKLLAETGEQGTLKQAEHESVQAAMKLVINSAYGYLGAEQMAWFGDREAADEITRRGREILEAICQELRRREAVLIEADTDGVYFSVPESWSEDQERRLVAEVASTLDQGLRLSFDGRYKAMFSHEIKNYALLHYDGHVTVRGAALSSQRFEPFALEWLHRALGFLLERDIQQIRNSYLKTLRRLKRGEVELADVTTGTRLTKTPAQYRQAGRKEAVYEAMLASGLTSWRTGYRARIYRARTGGWRLFRDGEAGAIPYDSNHYAKVLRKSYAERLSKAFSPSDFESLFRFEEQAGLFDKPIENIETQLLLLDG